MKREPFSYRRNAPPPRLLSDDLPDWVDWEDADDETTDAADGQSANWLQDALAEVADRETPDQSPGGSVPQQDQPLTLAVSLSTCMDCEHRTVHRHHKGCSAPIVQIGEHWVCGQCGVEAPPPGSCPECNGTVDRTSVELPLNLQFPAEAAEIEMAIHEETNHRRANHGIAKLEYSHHLSAIALQHSRAMAQRNFCAHTDPDGREAIDRYRRFGHDDRQSGENIARTYPDMSASPCDAAQAVVDEWMDSSGHRENILHESFDREGIGVYLDTNGGLFATQNFY